MKKNMKKLLAVAIAVVILASAAIAGTLAWLHDNEIIDGDVYVAGDLRVDLTAATHDGVILLPNRIYEVKPTMTVKANSEDCFVRMFVTFTDAADIIATMGTDTDGDTHGDIFLPGELVADWDETMWACNAYIHDVENDTLTYEFRYKDIVRKDVSNDQVLTPLFTTFHLPFYLNNDDVKALEAMSFDIEAQAIQAVNYSYVDYEGNVTNEDFDSAQDAWDALETQIKTNANYDWKLLPTNAADLVAAMAAGGEIVMSKDIVSADESEAAMNIITKDTVVELGANTITLDIPGATSATKNWNGINVNDGNVVLNATTGGITTAANGELYCMTVRNGATVTINGGNYVGGTTAVNVVEGTAYITGGRFEAQAGNGYVLNCIDANYANGTAKIVVTGGTFVEFDPSNAPGGENYLAPGYVVAWDFVNGQNIYTVIPQP